ncbi:MULTISPECIES: tyrosine-type recombinase/integrase [unclassified Streptomyces]|uniref:tyrosine-type recombinase/integrase n=1 Tax=unclassified Streptomyces TaxID=2593676 RepID=UPI001F1D4D20|nr:tyrosine-type recombinase/integrase [Streptomyces sp. CB01201]
MGELLDYHPHDFRWMFITYAIMSGLTPHIAQVIAGHDDINTTMHYNAVYPGRSHRRRQGVQQHTDPVPPAPPRHPAVVPERSAFRTARRRRGSGGSRPPGFDQTRHQTRNTVERAGNQHGQTVPSRRCPL